VASAAHTVECAAWPIAIDLAGLQPAFGMLEAADELRRDM
jgi:hypothetical protein